MSAYNAEERVAASVQSALDQRKLDGSEFSKDEYEVVVVNDGSQDRTQEILEGYGDQITLLYHENEGGHGHLGTNYGILHSQSDLIVKLDSDDFLLPGHIARCKQMMDDEGFDYLTPNYEEVFEDGSPTINWDVGENPFNCIAIGIMWRRSFLAKIGIYDPSFFFAEYDLMNRAIGAGGKRGHIEDILFRYVTHGSSMTTTGRDKVEAGRKALFDKWGEFPMREY